MRFVWARAVRAVLLRAFLGALGLMLQAVTTYFCGQGRISAKKLCCVTAFLAKKSIMWTSSVCVLFLVPDLLTMHTLCVGTPRVLVCGLVPEALLKSGC